MNKTEVLALLRANKNERGIANWKKMSSRPGRLKSFGIGLTQLRKLGKQIGRDHGLALKLWNSDVYDAKILGLLIDDPKQLTREQVEEQVENLKSGSLAHVFASCDATLPKAPFANELAIEWMNSDHEMRRHCGYLLVYEAAKDNRKSAPDDAFFLDCIRRIDRLIDDEKSFIRCAMGGALLGAGKRNLKLNKAALKVARRVGPISYDYLKNDCEPLDLVKHLTSDYVTKKLGL